MAPRRKRYWLVKSEADAYSIDDLAREGRTPWTDVRNYEARNLMRDEMAVGDRVLYYHSNAQPAGVVGIAEVASEATPDPTQFDETSPYYDPKSTPESPRWWLVDLAFVETFPRLVPLAELKAHPDLGGMVLVRRPRLSVQPVTKSEFSTIRELAHGAPKGK